MPTSAENSMPVDTRFPVLAVRSRGGEVSVALGSVEDDRMANPPADVDFVAGLEMPRLAVLLKDG